MPVPSWWARNREERRAAARSCAALKHKHHSGTRAGLDAVRGGGLDITLLDGLANDLNHLTASLPPHRPRLYLSPSQGTVVGSSGRPSS